MRDTGWTRDLVGSRVVMRAVVGTLLVCSLTVVLPARASGDPLRVRDSLWMLSDDRGILCTASGTYVLDAASGTVSLLARSDAAALNGDRKTLLIAQTVKPMCLARLCVYDLTKWPPQCQFETGFPGRILMLFGTGYPQLPYAAFWLTKPSPVRADLPSTDPIVGLSLLSEYRFGEDHSFAEEPIPLLSETVAELRSKILFCASRPYTYAAAGPLTVAAHDLLPKEAIIRYGDPWPDLVHLVVVVDGRKVWAYPVGGASVLVAFSSDGRRLLAGLAPRYGERPDWVIVDLKTGELKKAGFIPSDADSVLAANDDITAVLCRQRDVVFFAAKNKKPTVIGDFALPGGISPPASVPSTQDVDAGKSGKSSPLMVAEFVRGKFFVYGQRHLVVISPNGQVLSNTELAEK